MARRPFGSYLEEELQEGLREEATRSGRRMQDVLEAAVRSYLAHLRGARRRTSRARDRPEAQE